MNNNRNFNGIKVIVFILLVIFIYGGCGYKPIPVVVIREFDFRSDLFSLPLSESDKKALDDFLKSGGDREIIGPVGYYDEFFYSGIIGILSDDEKIEMNDLFVQVDGVYKMNDSVKNWFSKGPIYGVVDTREKRPSVKSTRPFSLCDGNLWWVFYREDGDSNWIKKVLVTVPITKKINHYAGN